MIGKTENETNREKGLAGKEEDDSSEDESNEDYKRQQRGYLRKQVVSNESDTEDSDGASAENDIVANLELHTETAKKPSLHVIRCIATSRLSTLTPSREPHR
ncbi:hypothetical protein GJ744_001362 [Endocarpon pusillum]|uniref:Uncharacterized protein n=1 Tax=Endocarpon pusillum TaxID=364733 RepID=A0A8H7E7S9_9EURO|nr:hypothetical protein GJ744_001362 [Endocarpon pusillum]